MVKRGGGVFDINVRRIPRKANRNQKNYPINSDDFTEWLVVHVIIDVCDAMGANCASTVAEGVAPFLAELTGGRIGLRIVSNLNVERISKVINKREKFFFLLLCKLILYLYRRPFVYHYTCLHINH
jgi:hypothetical protein